MSEIKSRPLPMEHDGNWDRIFNTCPLCQGAGGAYGSFWDCDDQVYWIKCSVCHGSGKVAPKGNK